MADYLAGGLLAVFAFTVGVILAAWWNNRR